MQSVPFEFGEWAFPLFATNLILLCIIILYNKNKLSAKIQNLIKFIFKFEVSGKTALIVVASLLMVYVGFSVGEISQEETFGDYLAVERGAENWNLEHLSTGFGLRYMFLHISLNLFGNIRIIPFIASISLLILTYYITFEISKKRFAGTIAMIIVLQSNLFLKYDVAATYTNFWTLFYLLSLYLIYKSWFLSPIFYLFSIFSKPLTAVFLPMTLFFTYRSNISKRKKILILLSYGIIVIAGIMTAYFFGIDFLRYDGFHYNEFLTGFKEFSNFLRFDGLITLFLLPLVVGLFVASRKGVHQADSLMVLIAGILLSFPLLTGFTYITNQPYRFIPLVVFFAISVGTLLSNNKRVNELNAHKEKGLVSYATFSVTLAVVLMSLASVIFPYLIPGHYRLVFSG